MKYKAIIFDMDGTIIDTEHIWYRASCQIITNRGITLTAELNAELSKQLNGCALPQSCAFIKELVNLEDSVESLIQEKSQIACSLYGTDLQFIDGFVSFHQAVIQVPLKVGIATNADDNTLKLTNQLLNLEKLFGEHMYNISHVGNKGKPDPAIYLYTAQKLGIKPDECIAIEDSSRGIKAAKDAGMYCIGINTTKRHDETRNADLIIDRYTEIDLKKLLQL